MKRILAPVMIAALYFASIGGCITKESTSGPEENSLYAGDWVLEHVATTAPASECGSDSVGVVKAEGPIVVDASGHFTIPDEGEGGGSPSTGTISSAGAVSVTLPNDPPCSTGSATGSCPSTDACAGTWSSNGQQGTWAMTRIVTTGYAGIWYLHHTLTVDDPAECGGDTLGVEKTEGPFIVFADGHFTLPGDDSESDPPTGTISPTGVVTVIVPGSSSPYDTCSAGTATGDCSTTSNCTGTYQQGGDSGTWRMTRTP